MQEVRTHAAGCDLCRTELAGLDETWRMLDALPATEPDSEAMRARFDAAADGFRLGMTDAPPVTGWRRRFANW
jgi:hypothetical protein